MKPRELTAKDVVFSVECLPEDTDFRGNCMASGNDAVDRECEDWIRSELDAGNEWAWCVAKVTAEYEAPNGQTFRGVAHLGGCSYKNEADFKHPEGYYLQMQEEALDDLNRSIAAIAAGVPS